jgi:hypothetical protein
MRILGDRGRGSLIGFVGHRLLHDLAQARQHPAETTGGAAGSSIVRKNAQRLCSSPMERSGSPLSQEDLQGGIAFHNPVREHPADPLIQAESQIGILAHHTVVGIERKLVQDTGF